MSARLEHALAHGEHGDRLTIYACAVALRQGVGTPMTVREPRPAGTVEAFASGCWFYPGSAVILRREALAQLGPQDESLPRLEDLDWFMRLALLGGKLVVTPVVGAIIERSRRPSSAVVATSRERLLAKWQPRLVSGELPLSAWRKLKAYLLVETAAAHWDSGERAAAVLDLVTSIAIAPRRRVQLSPGWRVGVTNTGNRRVAR